jgi:hypothetical protein
MEQLFLRTSSSKLSLILSVLFQNSEAGSLIGYFPVRLVFYAACSLFKTKSDKICDEALNFKINLADVKQRLSKPMVVFKVLI